MQYQPMKKLKAESPKIPDPGRINHEERLISAIDIAALGFYEMGKDHSIRFLDDRIRDFLGISAEHEAGARQFWLKHIHQDDFPYVKGIIREVLDEGVDRFALDYRYMHPERGVTWLHHLSRVLERDADGRATRIIGVMQDITRQKQTENILRENEKVLINNQKDLQRLSGRLISVQEEELRRLSRELHDDLTQKLAVLAIEAGKLEQKMNGMKQHLPEPIEKISQIKEQLIKISEDVHRISRQLHPTILEDLGLVRAIESECETLKQRENLTIDFTNKDIPDQLPLNISLCIYRIVQEGLNNFIRHSRAKRCKVNLSTTNDNINLTIKDKGMGFDPVEVRNKPGLGLSSMRDRVQLVQGNFSIGSRPGQGTTLRVRIPLIREQM
jgi:two-component system, NarL family, sensor histidine kinase UhpB